MDDGPSAKHPVVMAHPTTGAPLLYVNLVQTSKIVGMNEGDGAELLAELFSVLYEGTNVAQHPWENGDFLVWDNLALQRYRPPSPDTPVRDLRRTIIAEWSTAAQYAAFLKWFRPDSRQTRAKGPP
jgi:taurine dioxygenase